MPISQRSRNYNLPTGNGPYEAIVVSHLDTQYMGRLQVELLKQSSAGNQPERSGQLIEARYLSPFYGVTPLSSTSNNDGYEFSQKSYGFWAVPPDVGTRVLVILVEGKISQAYWIGCIQDEYMNFMVPGNAATENTTNFGSKVPTSEYNKRLADPNIQDPTKFPKPVHTELARRLSQQGLGNDDIRGLTSSSARREVPSMVFGWSTPGPIDKREGAPKGTVGTSDARTQRFINRLGGSTFVMDDGDDKLIRKGPPENSPQEYVNKEAGEEGGDPTLPANEHIRLRTRTGHQILMHNSEDLIYISNARGTSWIEMSSNGKLDIYAADSVSVHTQQDLNFTADRDINLMAGKNINAIAGLDYKLSAGASISNIAVKNISNNAGDTISEAAGNVIANYAEGAASYISGDTTDILAGANLALGSPSTVGIEGHGSVKITTDGDFHMKALGSGLWWTSAETSIKSDLALKVTSGNVIALKSTGNTNMQAAATNIKADGIIKIKGSAAEIQPGGALPDAIEAGEATIPAAPNPQVPTPALRAAPIARIPQHEPWYEHENLNPLEYSPDKTRANTSQTESYPPSLPDTFNKSGMRTNTSGGRNAAGTTGTATNGRYQSAPGGAPSYTPETIEEKKNVSRRFCEELRRLGWADKPDEFFYAAVACAHTESALGLLEESSYSGTSNERIRDIFSSTRSLTDSQLTTLKADKFNFFEYVYGKDVPTGRNLGNQYTNDGGNYIGRGLIQLTGRGNYQRYGKLAGLTDEDKVDPTLNPFGVTVLDEPGLLNTDLDTACAVAAAYLVERYRDRNRGILGNMRYCIAGSEKGFEIGIGKDQAFQDTLDESWIRSVDVPYPFIHPEDSAYNIHTFDTGDRRVDFVDRFARPFQLPASEGDFAVTRTNDQGGQIIIYVFQETDQIWFPFTIASYEAESGEPVPFRNLDNIVRLPA